MGRDKKTSLPPSGHLRKVITSYFHHVTLIAGILILDKRGNTLAALYNITGFPLMLVVDQFTASSPGRVDFDWWKIDFRTLRN